MDDGPVKIEKKEADKELAPSLISLKVINTTDKRAKLKHQNRELYSLVKLVKEENSSVRVELEAQKQVNKQLVAVEAVLLRKWNLINEELRDFLEKSQAKQADDPTFKKGRNLSMFLLELIQENSVMKKYALADITEELCIDDESNGSAAAQEEGFREVEEAARAKVAFSKKLIDQVMSCKGAAAGISSSKALKAKLEAFYQRSRLLETLLQDSRVKCEKLDTKFRIAVRRLNQYRSLEFLPEAELTKSLEEATLANVREKPAVEEEGSGKIGVVDAETEQKLKDEIEDLKALSEKREQLLRVELKKTRQLMEELEELKERLAAVDNIETLKRNFEQTIRNSEVYMLKANEVVNLQAANKKLEQQFIEKQHSEVDAVEKLNLFENRFEELEVGLANKYVKDIFELKKKLKVTEHDHLVLKKKHTMIKRKYVDLEKQQVNFKKLLDARKRQKKVEEKTSTRDRKTLDTLKKDLEVAKKQVSDYTAGKLAVEATRVVDEKSKEIEHLKTINSALVDEIDGISSQYKAETKRVQALAKENASLSQKIEKQRGRDAKADYDYTTKIKAVETERDTMLEQLEHERESRKALLEQIKGLNDEIETLNELKATSTELWKEATLARDDAETQREELRNELISLRAEKAKLGEETNRLVKRNKELLAVEREAHAEKSTTLQENAVLKRTVDRYKSRSTPEGNSGLRLEAMEQALRCPVNNQRWKTAMLLRCSHMFSKKVLVDTERSRNRKCPTCKTPFSKDDIVPIFLYQANEDED